ncbi:putative nuclease HARBI1 [Eurosta solidaginis]|uniref:putative nuclease HARBI1 n=1 Tax=Eurosta solidaginis TaxID=178769 RepID=UPI0035313279
MDGNQRILSDFAIVDDAIPSRREKVYKTRYDPFQMEEDDFYKRYRFDKGTVLYLIEILDINEPLNNRGLPISASLQFLTALRFLGRNVHQSDIGDLHGMSQATVGRVIHVLQRVQFPEVIGAIDCIHVRIKCPAKDIGVMMAGHYLNRKGYYSLNVQIVCDADCKILDTVARSRGSNHDARMWNECQLKNKLQRMRSSHNGVLLGDGGYPLSPILLPPVRNPSTPKEERYNRSHIATRSKIECLNGQIKLEFRSIFERLRVDLDRAKNVIIAVAVLHNIAKERNLAFLDAESAIEPVAATNANAPPNVPSTATGRAFRSAFINAHF